MQVWKDILAAAQQDRSPFLGPSGTRKCRRQAAYQYAGVPASDEVSRDAADLGTILHAGLSALIDGYDGWEADVVVKVPFLPRAGEADLVNRNKKIVADLKTKGDRAFQRWLDRGGPDDEVWEQLALYAFGLHGGEDGWTMQVWGVNRETGESRTWSRDFDRAAQDAALELASTMAAHHERLLRTAPEDWEREGAGPGRGFPCDWCPFRSACWPDAQDGLSPQAATVGDEEEVLAIAEQYLAASQEAADAAKRKADLAVFLLGRDVEADGLRVKTVRPRASVRPDVSAMTAALEALGQEVPVTTAARSPYIKVTRR